MSHDPSAPDHRPAGCPADSGWLFAAARIRTGGGISVFATTAEPGPATPAEPAPVPAGRHTPGRLCPYRTASDGTDPRQPAAQLPRRALERPDPDPAARTSGPGLPAPGRTAGGDYRRERTACRCASGQ